MKKMNKVEVKILYKDFKYQIDNKLKLFVECKNIYI